MDGWMHAVVWNHILGTSAHLFLHMLWLMVVRACFPLVHTDLGQGSNTISNHHWLRIFVWAAANSSSYASAESTSEMAFQGIFLFLSVPLGSPPLPSCFSLSSLCPTVSGPGLGGCQVPSFLLIPDQWFMEWRDWTGSTDENGVTRLTGWIDENEQKV